VTSVAFCKFLMDVCLKFWAGKFEILVTGKEYNWKLNAINRK